MTPPTPQSCALSISGETLSAWRDQLLDASTARELGNHIAGCPACQAQIASFDATQRSLASQRVPDLHDQVWRRLRPRIDGHKREPQMGRRTQVFGGLAAIAAVVLVALFSTVLLNRHSRPVSATPTVRQSATATQTTPATVTATTSASVWTPVHLDGNACTRSFLVASPADPQTLYACTLNQSQQVELSVSHDGGATWSSPLATPVNAGGDGDAALSVNPTDAKDMLLASEVNQGPNEVYRSIDGGVTWQRQTDLGSLTFESLGWAGSTALVLTHLTENPRTSAAELYASYTGGSFVRIDQDGKIGGYNFSQSATLIMTGTTNITPHVILLTFGQSVAPIFTTTVRSIDDGATWQVTNFKYATTGQVIDPLAASSTSFSMVGVLDAAPSTITYSDDMGLDWNVAPSLPSGVVDLGQPLIADDGTVILTTDQSTTGSTGVPSIYRFYRGTSVWTSPLALPTASTDPHIFVQQVKVGVQVALVPIALWTVQSGTLVVHHL